MRTLLLLALPLLAIIVTSCTKGSDDNGDTDIGGSGNGTERLVKSISTNGEQTAEIRYDNQNRIVQVKGYFDGLNMNYKIAYDDINKTATLSGNSINFVMNYNSDGNITYTQPDGMTYEYFNGLVSSSSANESYTWLEGKITKVSIAEGSVTGDWTMEYNNIENKLNINFPFGYGFTWELYLVDKAKGASSQYYPTLTKYFSKKTGDGFTATFQYFFDSDGYPTKIIRNIYYTMNYPDEILSTTEYTLAYY